MSEVLEYVGQGGVTINVILAGKMEGLLQKYEVMYSRVGKTQVHIQAILNGRLSHLFQGKLKL